MANLIIIEASTTYATEAIADSVVEKLFPHASNDNLRYFPVFIGQSAVQAGVHHHFTVIA